MKKLFRRGSLLLVAAIVASLCACSTREEPQSSDEMLSSAPAQPPSEKPTVSDTDTKTPGPSSEAPADSAEQTEAYTLDSEDFELFDDIEEAYHYIGQDQTIVIKDFGLEIHLPAEWVGQVEIVRNARPEYLELFIGNVRLMQAYADMKNVDFGESSGWRDWVLFVQAVRKDHVTATELNSNKYRIYLGENKTYCFYFAITDMHDMNCDTFMIVREMLIRDRGQEYYDDLVGDLTCTAEQAKEILKIL